MTEKYQAYLTLLATRDQVLMFLGSLGLLSVLGWEGIQAFPQPWQERMQIAAVVAGMIVFIVALISLTLVSPEGL